MKILQDKLENWELARGLMKSLAFSSWFATAMGIAHNVFTPDKSSHIDEKLIVSGGLLGAVFYLISEAIDQYKIYSRTTDYYYGTRIEKTEKKIKAFEDLGDLESRETAERLKLKLNRLEYDYILYQERKRKEQGYDY